MRHPFSEILDPPLVADGREAGLRRGMGGVGVFKNSLNP